MAITLTYGDLKNIVLGFITERCQNVPDWNAGTYKAALPDQLKNGNTFASLSFGDSTGKNGNAQANAYGTVSDSTTATHSVADVTSDFESFMTTCGINAKESQIISYRGLINF